MLNMVDSLVVGISIRCISRKSILFKCTRGRKRRRGRLFLFYSQLFWNVNEIANKETRKATNYGTNDIRKKIIQEHKNNDIRT